MIKPEDVPKEFVYEVVEKARRSKIDAELGKSTSNEQEIADLLNAAIEAGIVSPPCWAVKHDNGVLFGIFGTETEAELNSSGDDIVEHWMGYGR